MVKAEKCDWQVGCCAMRGRCNQIIVHCITSQLASQRGCGLWGRLATWVEEIYAIVQKFYAHRPCDTPKCDMNTLASAVMKKNKIGRWVSLTTRWGTRKSSSWSAGLRMFRCQWCCTLSPWSSNSTTKEQNLCMTLCCIWWDGFSRYIRGSNGQFFRQNFCQNSAYFRKFLPKILRKILP